MLYLLLVLLFSEKKKTALTHDLSHKNACGIYSTPELLFGERKIEKAYEKDPMESRSDLLKVLKKNTALHNDKDYEKYLDYKG